MTKPEVMARIRDVRLKLWYLIALVSSATLFYLYPHLVGTLLWKLNVVSLALIAGYWCDRSVFPDDRPGKGEHGWLRDYAYQVRRVLLMGFIVIAVSNIA